MIFDLAPFNIQLKDVEEDEVELFVGVHADMVAGPARVLQVLQALKHHVQLLLDVAVAVQHQVDDELLEEELLLPAEVRVKRVRVLDVLKHVRVLDDLLEVVEVQNRV